MNKVLKLVLFGFLQIILITTSWANSDFVEFRHVTTKNGLSNSDINFIVQDHEGFLWFGTEYGLNRYDGYEIKVYRNIPGDPNSLQDNAINSLYVDHEGILWIGTSHGGLSKYIKESDSFVSFLRNDSNNSSISYNYITYITEDDYKDIWIATLGGLNHFDRKTGTFKRYTLKNGLASDNLRTLERDGKGNLIIGYERHGFGILNIEKERIVNFPFPSQLLDSHADNAINSILIHSDEYWFATRVMGIFIYNTRSASFSKLNLPGVDKRSNFLIEDDDKSIWIATKDGLYNYKPDSRQITSYFNKECDINSLSNNSVTCLYKDRQGILWAGCMQGGVNFSSVKNGFTTYNKNICNARSLSQQSVSAVLADKNHRLWVGYFDNGVEIIDQKTNKKTYFYNLPTPTGEKITGTVFCFFEDSKGNIWVGTYQSGLFKYVPGKNNFINYSYTEGKANWLSRNDIRSISEDHEGNLWLGIHGSGVDKFNPEKGTFENFRFGKNNYGTSQASNWVFKVYTDHSQNIWVSSVSGLSLLSKGAKNFVNFSHSMQGYKNESLDVIWTLAEDSKNRLWLGSSMGLSLFDISSKKFLKVYTKNDGLPSDAIASIQLANDTDIWIGSYSGLVRVNPENLKIKTYLLSGELNSDRYFMNASYKNTNGELFFGGVSGLLRFLPDSISDYSFIPPVILTDFKLFNKSETPPYSRLLTKSINQTKEITLKYQQNVITFNFVALSYVEPEKNQYAYKLEGFDRDWNYVGSKRDATYTNLSPGNYVFHVKASNKDGVWNETGTQLTIRVKPPFWRTIWAFILYIVLLVGGLILYKKIIQNREDLKRKLALEQMESTKQIEMNNMRLRFFTNISHEFRTSLSLILGPTDILINQSKELSPGANQQVTLIRKNAQRLWRLINQLLDLRKIESGNLKLYPSPGDLVDFCHTIAHSFEGMALQKNIKFSFRTENASIYTWFDADKIEKIVYNLLSNAFKYTENDGEISLSISTVDKENSNFISIKVSDNGMGIPQEKTSQIFERFYQLESPEHLSKGGTGIGLSLVKELVEMHRGTISVESKIKNPQQADEKSGTTFTVLLPFEINATEINEKAENNIHIHQAEENISKTEKNHHSQQAMSLLIVEDNSELRKFIAGILENDFHIFEAENGINGLKLALEHSPDLIVSDIMMPGMQGTDLCKILKSDERTSHIPVILLTALSSNKDKIIGFELGADEYITKPFVAEVLKTRILNLIENRNRIKEKFKKHFNVEPKEIAITSTDEKFLNKAIEIVEKHMDDALFDVEIFTKELSVSRTLLHNKLKALTDLSATEFIKVIRIKRAAQLLTEGKLSVSEVSVMVGFNSRNYFTKCFTEHFGVSPSEYVKS